MGVNDNIYDKLQEFLGMEETNISIIEKSICSETQFEYFEHSRSYNCLRTENEIINTKDCLLDRSLSIDRKKDALVELASINNVEAYRAIENYLNQPNIKLYDWASMALNESRIQLESKLLEESKILITTGLGGKGSKLRYFTVFFTPNEKFINAVQRKIITKELEYYFRLNNTELEDIEFEDSFASILSLIPIKTPPKPIFLNIIKECNIFGNFLYNDFIITNTKVLDGSDIQEILFTNKIY